MQAAMMGDVLADDDTSSKLDGKSTPQFAMWK
jgi:hypothetical protein